MPRTPSPLLRRAVSAVKLGVATTAALLAVGPVLAATQDAASERAPGPATSDISAQSELAVQMAQHDCSASGFGPDVVPGSALVERDGRVRQVGFDEGWAVHTGDARGSLLAVCRESV